MKGIEKTNKGEYSKTSRKGEKIQGTKWIFPILVMYSHNHKEKDREKSYKPTYLYPCFKTFEKFVNNRAKKTAKKLQRMKG